MKFTTFTVLFFASGINALWVTECQVYVTESEPYGTCFNMQANGQLNPLGPRQPCAKGMAVLLRGDVELSAVLETGRVALMCG
ncbi:hypothetical protein E2P81_ATG11090 [Venturia nashicola]|uniref:Uncharacterized protein n=1 Tax=Venturia nashicola TaxID=86259 RepID=A0A4Z1P2A2_9PEZI|nr:hypothetical protein E6O75_ATG10768 [Venturia nashicola]TLD34971.1 hypothetical protein E2P81_ATG11090 [Venturia nashicola]